jgi:hypothetical protein
MLVLNPAMQYVKVDGQGVTRPLAFGEAHFYETETTTPVDVYQDSAFVNPHTNPVIADANGLFPPIYANPGLGLVRVKIIPEGGDLMTPFIDADPVNIIPPDGLGLAAVTFIASSTDVLAVGILGDIEVPFDCTITRVTLLADAVGSIEVDIWKSSYGGFPPTIAGAITAATPPAIVAAKKYQDSALIDWDTAISAGSILRFNIDSCTTIKRCTISLAVNRAA